MKRLDVEPTRENLLIAMGNDRAKRNDDIASFIWLLDATEGPYTHMIDSALGAGKTFFVKSVESVIRALNPRLTTFDTLPDPLVGFKTILGDIGADFVPFYFNAWENDFALDRHLCDVRKDGDQV